MTLPLVLLLALLPTASPHAAHIAAPAVSAATPSSPSAEIDRFNRSFDAAILKMDNSAVMALWDDDGTTLLPGMAALTGKQNIARWLDDITSKMPGYKVISQETNYSDIQVNGEWATEWGTTHQVVQPPDGKPVIDTHGKILLVLHRSKADEWRIHNEMWNGD